MKFFTHIAAFSLNPKSSSKKPQGVYGSRGSLGYSLRSAGVIKIPRWWFIGIVKGFASLRGTNFGNLC